MLNTVQIQGILEKKEALRYTLASIPLLEFSVRFVGSVREAGAQRVLNFSAPALAVGQLAKSLADEDLGTTMKFEGFLATTSARSSKLILHITEYEKGV